MFAPTLVSEIDLSNPLPDLTEGVASPTYMSAFVLVRLHTNPIGYVRLDLTSDDPRTALADAIQEQLAPIVAARLGSRKELLTTGVTLTDQDQKRLREREQAIRTGPAFSVVVSTRHNGDALRTCLEALRGQHYEHYEIIVVDNTDGDPEVESILSRLHFDVPVRHVVERHPGLSRARNTGAAAADGEHLAFIDGDAIADPYWLVELGCGYLDVDHAGIVNGAIATSALETQAQEWLRQYGGHSKGRGFKQQVFDPAQPGGQSPLYPLPPFGAGANMSFRRDVFREIGGFDEALGAGTPAFAAEETKAFTLGLLGGHILVFRPSAFVWHRDRETYDELRVQFGRLGTSLTAYYTALLWGNPRLILPLLRLLPEGLKYLVGGQASRQTATMDGNFPRELLLAHRRGMLAGPFAYTQGRRALGRARAAGPSQ